MSNFKIIRCHTLDSALEQEYRQYLTGHLQREQKYLPHIDDDIEVGISFYKTFTANKPHMHPQATEHGFVLQGSIKIRLLDGSHEEYQCDAGDFFVLQPGSPYASKNQANTKILFVKSPSINDKSLVDISEETAVWLQQWD